ncbi:hypothetical protein GLOIN_2v1568141 [Rhizophagus irregularis DAOM 181602=DAOM 197198]|uniref:Uncharacterized protein n=1 Tax=Rhizophagus irregularis (strain DAOM 181602 / DAOM 197198 / MUCL 43194) TaxID=747089 RepID=A0A2P4QC98_RHIID|nr:hypothetical protein GLOIN_2v1568141 [Rhizophagus irregularis DAOM 181602=DAOM 197198]POG75234.1 hypothetical protein GLOIN_2v1568141 [Rhizophagus irregularis DAOM 181602=DAOM 197198]|eukprot:XP_025182100.1 hypothetical protein GLOIN_2v1568141 [Rhizophagus irregularis DAOM 181602=DAOM 197198]
MIILNSNSSALRLIVMAIINHHMFNLYKKNSFPLQKWSDLTLRNFSLVILNCLIYFYKF